MMLALLATNDLGAVLAAAASGDGANQAVRRAAECAHSCPMPPRPARPALTPAQRAARLARALGIPADYARTRHLRRFREADFKRLVLVGRAADDGQPVRLAPRAAVAWYRLRDAAAQDGITLLPLSGFRSVKRQTQNIRRKLAAGRTIADIFAKEGEATFRALERQLVDELSRRSKTLISTGGGLPTDPDNLAKLKTHALVVCLWSSPEKIWERVRHQSHRPLLQDANPQKKIRELLATREPFYKQADVLVNTDIRSLREVTQQVALQFKLATRDKK